MHYIPSDAEKRFEPKGRRWSNMLLFDASTAAEVIRECRMDRIPILGIEGLILGEQSPKETVYADTADIVDFTSLQPPAGDIYDLSLAMVSDRKRHRMYFEFVFGDIGST